MCCCIAVSWYILFLTGDDVDGISFFAPSDSGGFRCRGNLSWVVCGSDLYGPSRVAKYAISRCLTSQKVTKYGIVLEIVCVSKCCGCDLCSRLCRACFARKRRLRPASAAELAPPTFSHNVRPQTSSHTAAALSRLVSLSPLLPTPTSILAVIHSLLHVHCQPAHRPSTPAPGYSYRQRPNHARPISCSRSLASLPSLLYGIINTP
jgi:hypothetical protein